MKLVYTKDNGTHKAGDEVKIGHTVQTGHRNVVTVDFFRKPHKPSSEGKITIRHGKTGPTQEVYVSVIGAEWIEREDRQEPIVDDSKYTVAVGATDDEYRTMLLVSNRKLEAHQVDIFVRDGQLVIEVENLNTQKGRVYYHDLKA